MRSDQPRNKSHFEGCGTEVWACHARSECKLTAGGNPQRSCHTARVGRFDAICAAGTIGIANCNSFKRRSLRDRNIGASEPTVATAGKWRERGTSTNCDGMTIQSVCHLMRIEACASIELTSHNGSMAMSGADFIDMLFCDFVRRQSEQAGAASRCEPVISNRQVWPKF